MRTIQQAIVAALGIGIAATAFAYDYDYDRGGYFDRAHVDRVDRIVSVVSQPVNRQECWQEPRDEYHPGVQYRREDLGPAVEIGTNGSASTTVRGQVIESGGYATRRLEEKCVTHMDYDQTPQAIGYDIVYSYRGEQYHDRMDHDPGNSVRVHVYNGYVELAE
jgi:hypothetical protein